VTLPPGDFGGTQYYIHPLYLVDVSRSCQCAGPIDATLRPVQFGAPAAAAGPGHLPCLRVPRIIMIAIDAGLPARPCRSVCAHCGLAATAASMLGPARLNRQGLWIRARASNPPDCADPGLPPDRRRDDVAKRPNTGRTATRASVGRRNLRVLNSFVHRLRTRPRLSRAQRHFGGSLRPSNVLGPEPSSKEGL
jgi:hypothetical protein